MNSPAEQGLGAARDDAANRAISRLEKMTPRESLMAAIDIAVDGGLNADDFLLDVVYQVTSTDEFGAGALRREDGGFVE